MCIKDLSSVDHAIRGNENHPKPNFQVGQLNQQRKTVWLTLENKAGGYVQKLSR